MNDNSMEKKESKKYEESIRVKRKATKEEAERFSWKIGHEISDIPLCKDQSELLERLEKFHAQIVNESYQDKFFLMYGEGNEKIILDELKKLEKFINKAKELDTIVTFDERTVSTEEVEYSRYINGYYDNKPMQLYHNYFPFQTAQVYGRYILYKKWLDSKLPPQKSSKSKSIITEDKKNKTDLNNKSLPLTHRQTAIIERFKIDFGYLEDYIKREGWAKTETNNYGKNREIAIRQMMSISKTYRPPSKKEIQKILPELSEFPKAYENALKIIEPS